MELKGGNAVAIRVIGQLQRLGLVKDSYYLPIQKALEKSMGEEWRHFLSDTQQVAVFNQNASAQISRPNVTAILTNTRLSWGAYEKIKPQAWERCEKLLRVLLELKLRPKGKSPEERDSDLSVEIDRHLERLRGIIGLLKEIRTLTEESDVLDGRLGMNSHFHFGIISLHERDFGPNFYYPHNRAVEIVNEIEEELRGLKTPKSAKRRPQGAGAPVCESPPVETASPPLFAEAAVIEKITESIEHILKPEANAGAGITLTERPADSRSSAPARAGAPKRLDSRVTPEAPLEALAGVRVDLSVDLSESEEVRIYNQINEYAKDGLTPRAGFLNSFQERYRTNSSFRTDLDHYFGRNKSKTHDQFNVADVSRFLAYFGGKLIPHESGSFHFRICLPGAYGRMSLGKHGGQFPGQQIKNLLKALEKVGITEENFP